jgi:hypothetical protein
MNAEKHQRAGPFLGVHRVSAVLIAMILPAAVAGSRFF